ncbi:MAG: hypothetical protein VX777_02260 [Chlamydiota bacterium]|nr:hypothetical protein [Chlamydiota bacterium]
MNINNSVSSIDEAMKPFESISQSNGTYTWLQPSKESDNFTLLGMFSRRPDQKDVVKTYDKINAKVTTELGKLKELLDKSTDLSNEDFNKLNNEIGKVEIQLKNLSVSKFDQECKTYASAHKGDITNFHSIENINKVLSEVRNKVDILSLPKAKVYDDASEVAPKKGDVNQDQLFNYNMDLGDGIKIFSGALGAFVQEDYQEVEVQELDFNEDDWVDLGESNLPKSITSEGVKDALEADTGDITEVINSLTSPFNSNSVQSNDNSSKLTDTLLEESFFLTESVVSSNSKNAQAARIESLNLSGAEATEGMPSFNVIGDLIEVLKRDLSDDTPLVYNKAGKLVADDGSLEGANPKKTIAIFKAAVHSTFGSRIEDMISKDYYSDFYGNNTLTKLTVGEMKKVFVGAAVLASNEDLSDIFNAIKREGTEGQMMCSNLLKEDMKNEIREADSFDELTPRQIQLLQNCFNTVISNEDTYVPTFQGVLKGQMLKPSATKFNNYLHDAEVLGKLHEYRDLNYSDRKLAISEHFAKKLIYNELKEGTLIPLLNEDSNYCLYQVEAITEPKGDGFSSNLIVPANLKNTYSEKEPVDVFLNCRGTCPKPSQDGAAATWGRDLEFEGVGARTFRNRESELTEMLEAYLKNAPDSTRFNLAGHSLGGCDTQRVLLLLMENINNSRPDSPWRKIKHISVVTHNAPKLENVAIAKMNKIYSELLSKIKSGALELKIDVTHVRFADKNTTDMVGFFGDKLAGAGIEESEYFTRKVMNVTLNLNEGAYHGLDGYSGVGLGTLPRHTTKIFSVSKDRAPNFELETIKGDDERIEQLLEFDRWSEMTDEQYENQIKRLASWYGSTAYTIPRNTMHYLGDTLYNRAVKVTRMIYPTRAQIMEKRKPKI